MGLRGIGAVGQSFLQDFASLGHICTTLYSQFNVLSIQLCKLGRGGSHRGSASHGTRNGSLEFCCHASHTKIVALWFRLDGCLRLAVSKQVMDDTSVGVKSSRVRHLGNRDIYKKVVGPIPGMMLGLRKQAINKTRNQAVLRRPTLRNAGAAEACVGFSRSRNTHTNQQMRFRASSRSSYSVLQRAHGSCGNREPQGVVDLVLAC